MLKLVPIKQGDSHEEADQATVCAVAEAMAPNPKP